MKRFTETNKWRDPWFRKLSLNSKALFLWLVDNCDNAGVIELDLHAASFDIGEPVDEHHLAELKGRLQTLANGKLWVIKFIPFQYGASLSAKCVPHLRVIELLQSHNIQYPNLDTQATTLPTRVEATLKEKDPTGQGIGQEGVKGEIDEAVPLRSVRHFPEAEIPSWDEFWMHCNNAGLNSEAYARDKFMAAEQENWSRQRNWRAYATRCKTWWESAGRPGLCEGKKLNGASKRNQLKFIFPVLKGKDWIDLEYDENNPPDAKRFVGGVIPRNLADGYAKWLERRKEKA